MGQVNSNTFSDSRRQNIPDGIPTTGVPSKKVTYESEYEDQPARRLNVIRPDPIYRCDQCTRFFYSPEALREHVTSDGNRHPRNGRLNSIRDANSPDSRSGSFCRVCKRSYACSILDHLNAALMHIRASEISRKDEEIERTNDCCVRCGIYFTSKEGKRKHFRDVAHHIIHIEAEIDSQTDTESNERISEADHVECLEYAPATFFPISQSMPPAIIVDSSSASSSIPASVVASLSSAYAPELCRCSTDIQQHLPVAARFSCPTTVSTASSAVASSMVETREIVAITDDFECPCPLCLESATNIASLPCGHIFCIICIHKALEADPRCPLCRRSAERRAVRRVWFV